jgi:hypothetical protein
MLWASGEGMAPSALCNGYVWHTGRTLQPTMPTVGFLGSATLADVSHWAAAFRQSLKDAGFVEGAERRESNTAQRTTDGVSVGSPLAENVGDRRLGND